MPADRVFVEEGEVLSHRQFPGGQRRLRLQTPRCAAAARPGSFVHLRCGSELLQRRPLSIMLADAEDGWIELLYKTGGQGLTLLSTAEPGATLHSMGPIGCGFSISEARPIVLLLGGGVGIPPVLFQARRLAGQGQWKPRLFLGSELPFPFALEKHGKNSRLRCAEQWGVPSQLASNAGLEGAYARWAGHEAGMRGRTGIPRRVDLSSNRSMRTAGYANAPYFAGRALLASALSCSSPATDFGGPEVAFRKFRQSRISSQLDRSAQLRPVLGFTYARHPSD